MHPISTDSSRSLSPTEQLEFARDVLNDEAQAIHSLRDRLGADFLRAIEILAACRGSVLVSGIGKAGLIGQKIVATLASTGTRSHFVHPAEAMHGDLGRIHRDDCLLILSFSGETEEILRLLPTLLYWRTPIIAMTGNATSTLARGAAVTLDLGSLREACSLGLAPSTSTTAMLALGDALALTLSKRRGFTPHDFSRYHPGGSLGRKLTKVEQVMRPPAECRTASSEASVRDVFISLSRPGRRTGAIMLVDREGRLDGVFTDSDLARLLESGREGSIGGPIRDVMTREPQRVRSGASLSEAWDLLAARKLSELPVVDEHDRPIGMIDITDVVALTSPGPGLQKKIDSLREEASQAEPDGDDREPPMLIPFPQRLSEPSA